jgi:uncharacterized protein
MLQKTFLILVILGSNLYADYFEKALNAYKQGEKEEAVKFYKKACDNGNTEGCGKLVTMYGKGDGVRQDLNKALYYMEGMCNDGHSKACHKLGSFYKSGKKVPHNNKQAIKFYKKACDNGFASGCISEAIVYQEGGYGVKRDIKRAFRLLDKECNKGNMFVCQYTGLIYFEGKEVRQNLKVAKEFFGKACDTGWDEGCEYYRLLNEQGIK